MSLIDRILLWSDRRDERRSVGGAHLIDDAGELGVIASRMTVDYRVAVAHGADCEVLAQILTGVGGCDLCQEVAYAAAEGICYRGVRAVEYQTVPVADTLREVALAYAGWTPNPHGNLGGPGEPVSVAQRLDELLTAVLEVTRGQAVETVR